MTLDQLKTKAAQINAQITIREEKRKQAIAELQELGINPDEIDSEIERLDAEIAADEASVQKATETLEAKIRETEALL
jgi:CRISPR/Cas system-associated endonuclease/helicase Cas3